MSTNRIDQTFGRLRAEKRAGFIAYICGGDPTLAATRDLVIALEEAGVDLIEIGIPFSDPLADGVVNQMASTRALAAGATLNGVLDCIREIRLKSQIPIVLYTYMNPVYRHGFDAFLADAESAGADGILFLDLPPDEDEGSPELRMHGPLKRIRLIAPTTPPARIARTGVTGERTDVAADMAQQVAAIKATTPLPVAVGFGVGNPEQVKTIASVADAVIVGSAIVKRIEQYGSDPDLVRKVADFVRPLAQATR